jgi:predicted nucleic acid-binding protein
MTEGEPVFLDTNVLLYAIDTADPEKQRAGRRWLAGCWETGRARTSWQVLNEFYVNATRKLGRPTREARALVETYAQWMPAGVGLGLVRRAWEWTDSAGVPYWDALILAASEASGCGYLLSEDFQRGRTYGSVRVIDPFRTDPEELGF